MSAYLDHAATTPMLPVAIEAMLPYLREHHENPSSSHTGGRAVRRAIDDARDSLAAFVGCDPGELVFTSGGTEADNLALHGAGQGGTVVISAVEHHAVLEPGHHRGARLAPVDTDGVLVLDELEQLLDEEVGLVSVMAVNNEVGVVQPLDAVAELTRRRAPRALLHCDAVQAAPWLDVASLTAAFDLVSVSAHKFGGPKGVGALVVRGRAEGSLRPTQLGGSQERELRPGTENVAGIIAAGAAASEWRAEREGIWRRVEGLRDRLEDGLVAAGAMANSPRQLRVRSIAPLRFDDVVAEELLFALDARGIAVSAGAACASGAIEPSHVLVAMGRSKEEMQGALRFSLGWTTTDAEIDETLDVVPAVVATLTSSPRAN